MVSEIVPGIEIIWWVCYQKVYTVWVPPKRTQTTVFSGVPTAVDLIPSRRGCLLQQIVTYGETCVLSESKQTYMKCKISLWLSTGKIPLIVFWNFGNIFLVILLHDSVRPDTFLHLWIHCETVMERSPHCLDLSSCHYHMFGLLRHIFDNDTAVWTLVCN